jgi:hypothetical protein
MLIDLINENRLGVVTTGTGLEEGGTSWLATAAAIHGGSQLDYHVGADCRHGDYIVEDVHRPSTGD